MTLSRRNALKLSLGAGAFPLLGGPRFWAAPEGTETAVRAEDDLVRARPLPLAAVRLTGGPLQHAQQLDAEYLLRLEPDRMLAYFRERAGLRPRAEPYGGWDGDGRNLTGHIAGHYLSAASLMWAATADRRFKERVDYLVGELKAVQDAHGDGYLCALEGGRDCFGRLARGEIRTASFDLNGQWAPWYTMHKVYGGLRDAYRYTGNRTALEVELALAAWAEGVLADLSDAQLQLMMNTEFGGMNEIFVDLYADTEDERWLERSYKFEHRDFIEPLARQVDNLAGKHGNTQVPKLIGSADRFTLTGRPADLVAAAFFWDRVANHHSFSTGGHGKDEYFGPPDRLSDRVDGRTAETCNVYNMLKLTRSLFALQPDAHYADFHERALFNHILASMDPEDGRTCYMVPVGRGVQHEYQDMMRNFTCCVGSGMESHALHGYGIYYEASDKLWINLYAPSTAEWSEAGVRLTMETDFPEGETATLRLDLDAPRMFTLLFRRPYWAGDGFAVTVNGQSVPDPAEPTNAEVVGRSQYDDPPSASSFVELSRTWRTGDVVRVTLPKSLRLERLPDDSKRASVMWGPLVLAGDLGPESRRRGDEGEMEDQQLEVPVFVTAEDDVSAWLEPVAQSPIEFRTRGVGHEANAQASPHEVDFVPFYRLHRRRYATYWDIFTPEQWEEQRESYVAEAERLRKLEAATVAYLEPGETVFEREFNFQSGEDVVPHRMLGRPGRRGRTWFSYDVPVQAEHPMVLLATYYSGDRRGTPADFQVLVDGQTVGREQMQLADAHRFFDVEYPIPDALAAGKDQVTVRFEAVEGSQIATVFGVRMIRGDDER